MMKKLLAICAYALLLGGCETETAPKSPPETPISPVVQQKIQQLNAGLLSLRELDAALLHSTVKSLSERDGQVLLVFRDDTRVTISCQADATKPLIGIAADGTTYYWTLAAQPELTWLKSATGERLPLSGSLPVMGVDDAGSWTVTTDVALAPWQIVDLEGDPIEATGEESAVLFRAVEVVAGRVQIAMTDGATLTVAKVEDLSATATANSYVVPAAGNYIFKATVRGNGVGDGVSAGFDPTIELTETMTATWLWCDKEGLISDVVLDVQRGEIAFTAQSGHGNALVVLMQGDEVVWSWHLWMTDVPQTMGYENGTVAMDRNLGAVSAEVGSTDAYGMYYQWGRKDPFYGGKTTETSATAFAEAAKNTIINPACAGFVWAAATGTFSTAAYAAAHPMTFLYNKMGVSSFFDWLAAPKVTLWGVVKSLNDPCPAGYKIPKIDAWVNFAQGRQYIDGVSEWDGVNYGMTYTYNGQTTWYPAQGYRNQNTGSLVGLATTRSGHYWSVEPAAQTSMFFYFQKKLTSSSGSINYELDKSRAYGYTVRCCKE